MFNQKVDTPLGEGVDQGKWAVQDGTGMVVAVHRLVRFTLNDEVEVARHLGAENCVTPKATGSALFHFPVCESGQIWTWLDVFFAVALLVIVIFFGDALGWPW